MHGTQKNVFKDFYTKMSCVLVMISLLKINVKTLQALFAANNKKM